ncbi:hypothetical protein GGR54DRAFT_605417 [Hypoxylon sp. NC1633]|nr:hypothetical protein GGR54DRAFT_605417 [Hypoxylon sp. NC1633]
MVTSIGLQSLPGGLPVEPKNMASATNSVSAEDMPFIVATGTKKKVNPELRKFIRSHVMMGRNKGKTLGPRLKKTSALSRKVDSGEGIANEEGEQTNSALITTLPRVIPPKVGSELSFIRFADTIEHSAVTVIIQFSSMAKKALFPLESCIAFGAKEMSWMEALTMDPAYLHAMAFSARDYFDLLQGRMTLAGYQQAPPCPHLVRTLQLLRERLDGVVLAPRRDDNDVIKTSFRLGTASVVLCLAFHSHLMGDLPAVRHHMLGLRTIVDLEGGLLAFKNLKLAIEILRCDLNMALHTGGKPLFFDDLAREPYWPYPTFALPHDISEPSPIYSSGAEDLAFLDILDPSLASAWHVIKQFSTLVNSAATLQRKLPKEYLFETMVSVMYRLLHMSFPPSHSSTSSASFPYPQTPLNEAIRLGLLAYSSSVFLQWAGVRLPYLHFPRVYRHALVNLDLTSLDPSSSSPQLLLWLLMVGAISVFDTNINLASSGDSAASSGTGDAAWIVPWLRVNVEMCGATPGSDSEPTWNTVRRVLDSFLWIPLVHDKPGKAVLDAVISLECPGPRS